LDKHEKHYLTDVNKSAEKFREQLNEDVNKLAVTALQKQVTQLQADTKIFIKRVASTQSEISQKYDQLISLMQSHQSQLMEELQIFNVKTLKEMETQKDEIERQFVITESFKRYCQEMINKGTACDISRMAHDLRSRAEELVKTQDEPDCHQLSGVEITFKPSDVTTDSGKNFIGELALPGQNGFNLLATSKHLKTLSFLPKSRQRIENNYFKYILDDV